MKKIALVLLALSLAFFLGAEVIDKIVAKVGVEIILKSDLDKQINQLKATGLDEALLSRERVLEQMIEHRLLIQKAKELNISVDDDAINKYAANYINELKSKYPSEAAFQADLKRMKSTQRDLQDFFANQIKENALTEQMIDKYISSKVKISEAELRSFYESSKDSLAVKPLSWDLSMILREIKPAEDSDRKALAEAELLLEALNEGADFAELAREFSDCPSKSQGGDLGFFKRGMMVKPFEDAAFALYIGETSGIVKTDFGYHIIRVTDKRGNEIRASHILKTVGINEADEEREIAFLTELRDRILEGESFAELAREYSEEPYSAKEGGYMGEFAIEDLPELFAAPILAAPVGIPTEVLHNEGYAYLFIRTLEHQERLFTFEEVKDRVQQYLYQLKQMQAYDDWMEDAKRKAFIEIRL